MTTVSEQTAEFSTITYPRALAEYQHDGVIRKFRDEWNVDENQALDIFPK